MITKFSQMINHILGLFKTKAFPKFSWWDFLSLSYYPQCSKLMHLAFLYWNTNLLREQEENDRKQVFCCSFLGKCQDPKEKSFLLPLKLLFLSSLFLLLGLSYFSPYFCLQPVDKYILKKYAGKILQLSVPVNKPFIGLNM